MNIWSKFENPSGLDRPLWYDVSYWQGVINAEQMLLAGANGCVVRACVGRLYRDPYFAENWTRLGQTWMCRASYGVYVPGQQWLAQLDNWYTVAPGRDVIPRVIDLEIQDEAVPAAAIAADVWKWVVEIEKRDGARPIIYSRANLVDLWIEPYWTAEQINSVYWWMAQYTWDRIREHPGPPTITKKMDRNRVVLHQTADKKPAPEGIVRTKSIDWDRWELGSTANMREFIKYTWGNGTPEPEPEPGQGLWFRCVVDSLNVRRQPNTLALIVGKLKEGDEVKCTDVGGGNAWVWIGTGWVCKEMTGKVYLEKIDGPVE